MVYVIQIYFCAVNECMYAGFVYSSVLNWTVHKGCISVIYHTTESVHIALEYTIALKKLCIV